MTDKEEMNERELAQNQIIQRLKTVLSSREKPSSTTEPVETGMQTLKTRKLCCYKMTNDCMYR